MTIRLRLTLLYAALLAVTLLAFDGIVYVGVSWSLQTTLDNHLLREVDQIIEGLKVKEDDKDKSDNENGDEYKDDEQAFELGYIPEEGVLWRVMNTKGQALFDPEYFKDAHFIDSMEPGEFGYARLVDDTLVRFYTSSQLQFRSFRYIIQVAESFQTFEAIQGQLTLLLTSLIPPILLIASIAGWFLAQNALHPIDRITRTAQSITTNALNQRLTPITRDDEVGRLINIFNDMLDRLQVGFEQQKRLIADTSHELRTPLTILKGDVEVALNRPRSAAYYQEILKMVQETADGMTKLVEELLLLARSDNQQYPLHVEKFNLTNLLSTQIEQLHSYATQKHITLTLNIPPYLPIQADFDKLGRSCLSVIDNAIKYSDAGSTITVTTTTRVDSIAIAIADEGPGIASEHLPHLFERFYRVDKSRSRNLATVGYGSGAGLGLSIVQTLVQAHGGRIDVQSTLGQGTTFIIWLPTHLK